MTHAPLIPAKAGIHPDRSDGSAPADSWVPASAGTSGLGD